MQIRTVFLAFFLLGLAACDRASPISAQGPAPDDAPEGRMLVDAGRGRIWTLTREGLFLQQVASAEKRAIALPGWVSAGPPYGGEPALALGPGGDVVVTSDVLPVLWRVEPRTLAVVVHPITLDAHRDQDVGFTSLAYSMRDGAFVAESTVPKARWRIDAGLTRAERIGQ